MAPRRARQVSHRTAGSANDGEGKLSGPGSARGPWAEPGSGSGSRTLGSLLQLLVDAAILAVFSSVPCKIKIILRRNLTDLKY